MANTPTPTTVATPANTGGSNKSVPAPTVAVPASVKKWLPPVFVTLLVIIGIVLIASVAYSPEQKQAEKATLSMPHSEVPLVSAPPPSKMDLPARGKTGLIPPVAGMHPAVTGFGRFLVHNVFVDDTECAFGEAGCVNGPVLRGYYVSNESDELVTVTVKFK